MPEAEPTSGQTIMPMLAYADAAAAIDFLVAAFGFEESFRFEMDDGRIGHAELSLEGNTVMLASVWRELGFSSPKDLAGIHTQLFCYVADVDQHYERARAAGATVIAEPRDEDHGARTYRAIDCEGGRWIFGQRIEQDA